ncbi:sugar hydrolase [Chania multitudinisentens RB-25]|uniref:Sugar hydrolase n=1 Tax=Chania multitudinisentens RB-25 TaxID=1441930 RepID=W0LDW9_9GAMM|nr:family 78 glycoside hydrolase catalytic domain [Chania multitudinisentens]AHG20165.1 sugar hydrolase [Chania multitudinisentens RB-25]
MSQVMQKNQQVKMVRHGEFLSTAASLIPKTHSKVLQPKSVINVVADSLAVHGWRSELVDDAASFLKQAFQPGDSFILDFGTHGVGWLTFCCDSAGSPPDAPAHLRFTFGETLCEVAEPFSSYQGWLSSSWLQQHDEYIDLLPSTTTLSRRYCCRYLKVDVIALSPKYQILMNNMTFTTVSSAPESCLPFKTHDPALQKIDEVSVLTLRNCMQEVFEDGPKRDRRLWLGDLRLQALVNDVTFAQHDLVRRCLYLFAGHRREDGMVSASIFVKPDIIADDTFLFDYSLFFIDVLHNYLLATNDVSTAKELWPVALRQVELALNRCDHIGLVNDCDDWWSFIDWHDDLNKQGPSQGVLIYCIEKAIELAKICQPKLCDQLQNQLNRHKLAANELWDNELGFYVSGKQRQVSCATQIWMVLADVGDLAHQKKIMENLLLFPPAIGMNTPYLRHHFIAALLKTGLRMQAVEEIKAYWGKMVEYGADTFWELFDPERPDFSPYGSKIINSYCHAWSCTPAWFIRQYGL